MKRLVAFVALFVVILAHVQGTVRANPSSTATVTLVPDLPSGQPVGITITWTVTTIWSNPVDYRFSVAPSGERPKVMYDFCSQNEFKWTPIEDGTYVVVASVRNLETREIGHASYVYVVESRVTDQPIVTSTDHPLVALYSAPPCQVGYQMRVVFEPVNYPRSSTTSCKPCQIGHSMNFYIAGIWPDSAYHMLHQVLDGDGAVVEQGPLLVFRTGRPEISLPRSTVVVPPDAQTSFKERVLLLSLARGENMLPISFATDLSGRVIWYYDVPKDLRLGTYVTRPMAGGTMLVLAPDFPLRFSQVLREIDLAGNTVRETNRRRISEQLRNMGHDPISGLHHDAIRIPNGHTLVIGGVERIVENAQGPGPVNILGDMVIALDDNWQVAWAWNSFDHMDITRKASLNETCSPVCHVPLFRGDDANDWTHSNAIAYSPSDGNLLLSVCNQDWVIKIDYRDGKGTGDILWRLGRDGDFTIESSDSYPWFTHQHDAHYEGNQIVLFDNGNLRCVTYPDFCHSRGQVYRIDETKKTASLVLNADLGNYSEFLGAAQELLNGDFHFTSGWQLSSGEFGVSQEVLLDGTMGFSLETRGGLYRTFRMEDLYTPPTYLAP